MSDSHEIARRSFLTTAAALAVAAVAPRGAVAATEDPVVALVSDWERLGADMDALSERIEALWESLPDWVKAPFGRAPEERDIERQAQELRSINLTDVSEAFLASWTPEARIEFERRRTEAFQRSEEYRENALRELSELEVARNAIRRDSGFSSMEKRFEDLLAQRDAVEEKVWPIPATTIAGVAAKLAIVGYHTSRYVDFDNMDSFDRILVSARRDAEHLSGAASN